jgi:hypothetical protein
VVDIEVLEVKPHPARDDPAADLEDWARSMEGTLERVSRQWRFRAAVDRATNLPIEDDMTVNILFEITT